MICSLDELNNKINDFVNYIVKTACERTTSGNYFVSVSDAMAATGMAFEDFLLYKELILDELYKREEVLDHEFLSDSFEFDINCALDYCPSYHWCDGDEEIFKCSFEEWQETPAKPVSQPLSMARMAEIGQNAISYVFDVSDIALEDLTESLGMSIQELEQMGFYESEVEKEEKGHEAYPILFFVNDSKKTHMYGFETFEDAFKAYTDLGLSMDKSISYSCPAVNGSDARGDLLLKYSNRSLMNFPCRLDDVVLDNPYIKLAYSKAILSCYPNDENAWAMRDAAEKTLGITDRIVDTSKDLRVNYWRIHVVPTGGHYGSHNQLINEGKPFVEFYDITPNSVHFPDGQYVTSYRLEDLVSKNPVLCGPLCLYADIPQWTVSAEDMREVVKYLRDYSEKYLDRKLSLSEKIQDCERREKSTTKELPEPIQTPPAKDSKGSVVR